MLIVNALILLVMYQLKDKGKVYKKYPVAPPYVLLTCSLYYKSMTIVIDDSRVVNKLEASLTDDARVIIYDSHMFIVQATDYALVVHR
jgi:hypothetical protein